MTYTISFLSDGGNNVLSNTPFENLIIQVLDWDIYIVTALKNLLNKQDCVALFIDLSEAFANQSRSVNSSETTGISWMKSCVFDLQIISVVEQMADGYHLQLHYTGIKLTLRYLGFLQYILRYEKEIFTRQLE